jgi:RNA-directed DNA polymerase
MVRHAGQRHASKPGFLTHLQISLLPKHFGKYGLSMHPTKTKLVPFCPPSAKTKDQSGPGDSRPGTFDLLGLTHYWGRSLRGYWVIKQKTAAGRFSRAVRSIDQWCRDNRHLSIAEQQQKLNEKLRGHYAYYGVELNRSAVVAIGSVHISDFLPFPLL